MYNKEKYTKFIENLEDRTCWERALRWKLSPGDHRFWGVLISILKENNIKNIFDVACGDGEFVRQCIKNDIDAYGIDPRANRKPLSGRLSVANFHKLVSYVEENSMPKFDCITILNTLHSGKAFRTTSHVEQLIKLFEIFKKYTKYVVISEPNWEIICSTSASVLTPENLKKQCGIDNFKIVHSFGEAYGDPGIPKIIDDGSFFYEELYKNTINNRKSPGIIHTLYEVL